MGCGESKHVATGNTISRKSSRAGSKRGKGSESIEEITKLDTKTSSTLVKEEAKNADHQVSGADNSKAVADGKDMAESKELRYEQNVEPDKEKKNTGVVKENEEPVEGISFEGISGRSEYFSPEKGPAKESLSNENLKPVEEHVSSGDMKLSEETKKETVEDTKLAEETKQESVQEIKLAEETKEETRVVTVEDKKPEEEAAKEETVENQKLDEEKKEETANGETETVKEENLVKETQTAETTTEAEVLTPVEKQQEEKPASSSAEELKAE